ncbi:MAG: hypothetical protein LBL39_07995 [Planctomycetaceae bacterium]|nr:hypothetical protein [Planctomycetaceae bacterium]
MGDSFIGDFAKYCLCILGFILFKLLAFVAIVGVLNALFLPTIQAKIRSQCYSNFRQLGLNIQKLFFIHELTQISTNEFLDVA